MSVLADIGASYVGTGRVLRRLLAAGPREDRALAILMAGCTLVFIAQWPRLSREAHLSGQELAPLVGGTLMAWLFIMPLALYLIAFLSYLAMRLLRGKGSPYQARLVLFWALLASTPLVLLWGLIAGLIGPGPQMALIGALWTGCFLWFWASGLRLIWREDAV